MADVYTLSISISISILDHEYISRHLFEKNVLIVNKDKMEMINHYIDLKTTSVSSTNTNKLQEVTVTDI